MKKVDYVDYSDCCRYWDYLDYSYWTIAIISKIWAYSNIQNKHNNCNNHNNCYGMRKKSEMKNVEYIYYLEYSRIEVDSNIFVFRQMHFSPNCQMHFSPNESAIFCQTAKFLITFRQMDVMLFRQMVSDCCTCGFPNGPNQCVPNPWYGHDGVRAWSCGSEN